MHNAPAVNFPVGRSALHGWLIALVLLLTLMVDVLWLWQAGQMDWPAWGALSVGVMVAMAACWDWYRQPAGLLRWDGTQWYWLAKEIELPGDLSVRLDWQRAMLLEFQPGHGPVCWFWVTRNQAPVWWEALRRAVHAAHRRAQAEQAEPEP